MTPGPHPTHQENKFFPSLGPSLLRWLQEPLGMRIQYKSSLWTLAPEGEKNGKLSIRNSILFRWCYLLPVGVAIET